MEHLGDQGSFSHYFFKYLYINGINLVAVLGGFFILRFYCLMVSNKFFKRMSNQVLKAPVNTYFDTTPSGWILNWFSKDLSCTDSDFCFNIHNSLECSLSLVFTLYVACLTSLWILVSVPVIIIVVGIYTRYYIRCYWDLVRMDSIYNSPVITHLGETISGATTIRAYHKEDYYMGQAH